MPDLDINFIRSQFPGLNTDWVLFDNAGGSQILKPVVDRMVDHFYTSNVQLGGSYHHSLLAEERHARAHLELMKWVNASDPSELILGSSTSLLIRTIANNLLAQWKPGDEVIVTNCDHEANIGAWRQLADHGIVIKEWKVNPDTFMLDKDDLKQLLGSRTKLVAFTAASNVLGILNPIREFTDIAHSAGALTCVDGVAYAPHRLVDVQEMGTDFFVFSFYKTYGPHYAMMYGKKQILESLPGNNHFFISESPYKFQPGNYNFEFCYSTGAIPEYFINLAGIHGYDGEADDRKKFEFIYSVVAEHEEELSKRVIEFLKAKPGIRIIGSVDYSRLVRVPTIAFVKEHVKSDSITLASDKDKVAIRWGDFYARRLVDDLGLTESNNGVVRISMVHYNTIEEADRLVRVLDKII
jgi:cysteine desulfurase family protein (TIGR01976 family)